MNKLTRPEEVTKRSYDRLAKEWAVGHNTDDFWGENLQKFHELLPKGKVLEIGCGSSGRDARDLIKLGYDYTGTDISSGQITEARKQVLGAHFIHQSVYDLNFNEPFDGFWAAAVLLHVPKTRMDEALQSIRRNLRDHAIGFVAMKEGDGQQLEARPELDNANFLFSYWQREDFRESLAQNGFESLHEGYIPMSERSKWLTYIVRNQ